MPNAPSNFSSSLVSPLVPGNSAKRARKEPKFFRLKTIVRFYENVNGMDCANASINIIKNGVERNKWLNRTDVKNAVKLRLVNEEKERRRENAMTPAELKKMDQLITSTFNSHIQSRMCAVCDEDETRTPGFYIGVQLNREFKFGIRFNDQYCQE